MKEVVISNNRLNSYGFRVLTSGIDITQYMRNPILLWMHNRAFRGTKDEVLPLGKIDNLRIDGDNIIGTPVFDDKDPFALSIKNKWEAGMLKMASAGIDPIEVSSDPMYLLPGQTRGTVVKSKLIEVSIVDIGSNDDAIQLMTEGKLINLSQGSESIIPLLNTVNNNKKEDQMKVIALKLGLQESATEADVLSAITALQNKANAHDGLVSKVEGMTLANITGLVDSAVSAKKITADKKDHFIALGKTSGIESLRATLDMIQPAVKPTDVITPGAPVASEYKKLSDVPSEKVLELREKDKETYIKLFVAEYGFAPEIK